MLSLINFENNKNIKFYKKLNFEKFGSSDKVKIFFFSYFEEKSHISLREVDFF